MDARTRGEAPLRLRRSRLRPSLGAMNDGRRRSAGEWSILALLAEAPAHGWALSVQLEPRGEIGAIWSLSRPLVYRALELLREDGLVEPVGASASTRGPSRALYRPTRRGRATLARWLSSPVEHVRDLRPDLLLKLIFLQRAGKETAALLVAQHARLELFVADLERELEAAPPDHAMLVRYRLEIAHAALRFVEAEQLACARIE